VAQVYMNSQVGVTVKTGIQECGTEYKTEQNTEWRIKVKFCKILQILLELDIFLYDVDAFQTSLNGFMQVNIVYRRFNYVATTKC